jgi:uncharacterized protein (DUF488 family)
MHGIKMQSTNMKDTTIYSIGHGNKNIEEFVAELKAFGIQYLLDIRSKPFSKWSSQYNQNELKFDLEKNNIKYVFLGNTLGGLPDDRSCYNSDGKVVYELIKDKEFFKKSLQRLITANEKNINVAIMCSESKPEECHRSKLIGEELLKKNISIKHIISKEVIKTQEAVINELTKGKNTIDIFGESLDFTSRKSY